MECSLEPGAVAAARSSSARPGVAPDTDANTVEAQKFAHRLAKVLEKGLHEHADDRRVPVAPPHFLGGGKGCAGQLAFTID